MSQQTDNIIVEGAKHAELSLAAYANLSVGKPNVDNLVDDADMTQSQAEAFAATWRVVDQFNSLTGASATIFEKIDNPGERHLAIRGTEPTDIRDWFADLLIAVGLSTSFNPQYAAIRGQVAEWIDNGTLTQFDAARHSSAGAYSAGLRQDFSANVTHAYGYLAPGPGGFLGDVVEFPESPTRGNAVSGAGIEVAPMRPVVMSHVINNSDLVLGRRAANDDLWRMAA